ncbi:MAG: ThuA domain-containing protein, partial [Gemmataceae bacterium]
MRRRLSLWSLVLIVLLSGSALSSLLAAEPNKKLLLVTHSLGFIHDSVGLAEDIMKEQGPKQGFDVTCYRFTGDNADKMTKYKPKKDGSEVETTVLEKYSAEFRQRTGKTVEAEHCGRINKETLKKFDVVFFFTTGNPLTKTELVDLLDWVKAGGAFAGTHCATDTLYNTAYGELVGGYFDGHPWTQKIKL